jgi:hypothetical protein
MAMATAAAAAAGDGRLGTGPRCGAPALPARPVLKGGPRDHVIVSFDRPHACHPPCPPLVARQATPPWDAHASPPGAAVQPQQPAWEWQQPPEAQPSQPQAQPWQPPQPQEQPWQPPQQPHVQPWQPPAQWQLQPQAQPWQPPHPHMQPWQPPQPHAEPWQPSQPQAQPWQPPQPNAQPWQLPQPYAQPWQPPQPNAQPWQLPQPYAQPWQPPAQWQPQPHAQWQPWQPPAASGGRAAPCRTASLDDREVPSSFACPGGHLSVRKGLIEALWPGLLAAAAAAGPAAGVAGAKRLLSLSAAFVPAAGDAEAERVLRAHKQQGPCRLGQVRSGNFRLNLLLAHGNPLVAAAIAARGAGLRLAEAVWRDGPPGREVEGGLLQLVLRSGPGSGGTGSAGAARGAGGGGGGSSVSSGGWGASPSGAAAFAGSPPSCAAPCRTAPLGDREVPASFAQPSGALFVRKTVPEALWPGRLAPLLFSAAFAPAAGDAEAARVLGAHRRGGPCRLRYGSGQFWLSLPLGESNPLVDAAVAARGAGLRLAEAAWRDGPPGREVEGGLLQLVLRSGGQGGHGMGSPGASFGRPVAAGALVAAMQAAPAAGGAWFAAAFERLQAQAKPAGPACAAGRRAVGAVAAQPGPRALWQGPVPGRLSPEPVPAKWREAWWAAAVHRSLRGAEVEAAASFGAPLGTRRALPDELRACARWLAAQMRPPTPNHVIGCLGEAFAFHYLCITLPGFHDGFVWTALLRPNAGADFELAAAASAAGDGGPDGGGGTLIEVKATSEARPEGSLRAPPLSSKQRRDYVVGPSRSWGPKADYRVVYVTSALTKQPRVQMWEYPQA